MVSGTVVSEAWRTTHEPSRCSDFFSGEKCSIVIDLAVADDHVGAALDDRRDELGDVAAVVLVVGVGVDDDVGAELQARVQAGLEAGGQALVVRQPHDVVDSVGARHRDRPSVEPSSMTSHSTVVEAGNLARKVGSVLGKLCSSLKQGIWMISFIGGP